MIKKQFVSYQKMIFFLLIFTMISRGAMFLSTSIGIDTEVMIALKENFFDSWLGIGRFGLVLLKMLSDTLTFNPYLTGIGVLLLLPTICMLWVWLFDIIVEQKNKLGAFFCSLIIISSTIMTEQLYFKLQAMEICIGLCMLPASLLLIYESLSLENKSVKKWLYLIISIAMNVILFSLYQVMVPLFIAGVAMSMFLYVYSGNGKVEPASMLWKKLGMYVGIFLISFVLNQLIVKIWFSSGESYLSTQIFWTSDGFMPCVQNILQHLKEIAFGTQIYYAKTFSVYVLIILIYVILWIQKLRKQEGKSARRATFLIVCMLGVLCAPFYMTLLCGRAPVIRSQLVYPVILGFLAYVSFLTDKNRRLFGYVLLFAGAFTVFLQVKYSSMLQYSDMVRYQSDVRIANAMMQEIDDLQNEDFSCPVVFWGSHPAELNASCIKGEVIGYSFFEWDSQVEPIGTMNTRRILSFMHTLGKSYPQASEEQIDALQKQLAKIPNWPNKGSICKKDNVIIVKMSDYE